MHDEFGTYELVDAVPVPNGKMISKLVVARDYKHDEYGRISGHKILFAYPGNRIFPGLQFNIEVVAACSDNRASLRLVLPIAAQFGQKVRHIDIKTQFQHEYYDCPEPLYYEPPKYFDGKQQLPNKLARMFRNIYGTPNASLILTEGLRRFLKQNGYQQLMFDVLKAALTKPPALRLPKQDLPYSVKTHECSDQIVCALLKTHSDGTRYQIGFWSRSLIPEERN